MIAFITRHFQAFLALGLVCGLAAAPVIAPLSAATDYLVMAIIFLGFLTRPGISAEPGPSWLALSLSFGITKFAFPAAVFFAGEMIVAALGLADSGYPVAFMLLAALPAAGVSPALARLTGGDVPLSLRLLLMESVFVCLTIPALFWLFAGDIATVTPGSLAAYLPKVLLLPLLAAEAVRASVGKKTAASWAPLSGALSVLVIATLVAAITAVVRPLLWEDAGRAVMLLVIAMGFAAVLAAGGCLSLPRQREAVTVSMALKNMYINIGLGLGIATAHLGDVAAMTLLCYLIPINLLPHAVGAGVRRWVNR